MRSHVNTEREKFAACADQQHINRFTQTRLLVEDDGLDPAALGDER
jgi:hypothetical protein